MDLFDLCAKLSLDSSEYEKGLDDAESTAESKGGKIGKVLSKVGKGGALAVGAITAGVTALTTTMVSGTKNTAAYGDNIDKMSQKMGISAQAYQEWEAVMQHSGTSMETLKAGMKTLANAVENGNAAFERLGISQQEISKMSNEELFSATITALQGVENETERTYLAGQLLGRGATELGALLNTSAEETQAMKDRVHELGGVMSDEAVKNAAAFQDSLQDMQTSMSGLSNSLMSTFLPSLTTVMDGLGNIFAGDDSGLAQINQGVSDFTGNIISQLPKILEVGTNIIEGLASAIIENIPALFTAATEVIVELVGYLIENLPLIIDSALEIILALSDGLITALPELIPTIVDVVIKIVDTLIENIDLLVDASIAIIMALGEGLIKALPKLLEKAPEIINKLGDAIIRNIPKLLKVGSEILTNIIQGISSALGKILEIAKIIITKVVDGIKDGFNLLKEKGKEIIDNVKKGITEKLDNAKEWGKDMIQNFIGGITEKWNALKDKVSGVAQTVKNFLGFSEPKEGPLSNFHTYAPDMMKLFAQGIKDNEDLVTDQIAKSFDIQSDIPMVSGDVNGINRNGRMPITNGDGIQDIITEAIREALSNFEIDWDGKNLGRLIQKYV